MAQKLTEKIVSGLQPRPAGAYYVSDAEVKGLQLRIAEDGSKSWSVRYRIGNRQRRFTLGKEDDIDLKLARAKAALALGSVRTSNGKHDPAQEMLDEKRGRRTADTVAQLASTYMQKHAIGPSPEKPRKRSWKNDQSMIDHLILPRWKNRLVVDIKRRDVIELLDQIAERGPILANRTRALLHKLFKFACQRDLAEGNPVTGTERPGKEQKRARLLSEDEIRQFWRATEAWTPAMSAVFRLRLLTAQRGGEVINMRWCDLDLDNMIWTIPVEHSKNKKSHRVPLSTPALDILLRLRKSVDRTLEEARNRGKTPKEPTFVMRGVRGTRVRGTATKTLLLDDFRGHDLRRTAATWMGQIGVQPHVIARVLNHSARGVTEQVYMRYEYDAEKKVALDAWARMLTQIVEGGATSNVLAFAR